MTNETERNDTPCACGHRAGEHGFATGACIKLVDGCYCPCPAYHEAGPSEYAADAETPIAVSVAAESVPPVRGFRGIFFGVEVSAVFGVEVSADIEHALRTIDALEEMLPPGVTLGDFRAEVARLGAA